jgi:hypothetical protein
MTLVSAHPHLSEAPCKNGYHDEIRELLSTVGGIIELRSIGAKSRQIRVADSLKIAKGVSTFGKLWRSFISTLAMISILRRLRGKTRQAAGSKIARLCVAYFAIWIIRIFLRLKSHGSGLMLFRSSRPTSLEPAGGCIVIGCSKILSIFRPKELVQRTFCGAWQ